MAFSRRLAKQPAASEASEVQPASSPIGEEKSPANNDAEAEEAREKAKAAAEALASKRQEEAAARRERERLDRQRAEEMAQMKSEVVDDKARQERMQRSMASSAAKPTTVIGAFGSASKSTGGSFSWKARRAEAAPAEEQPAAREAAPAVVNGGATASAPSVRRPPSTKTTAARPSPAAFGVPRSHINRPDMPSRDACELAISAMITRSTAGMKEGLQKLGLPDSPLVFVPGQELRLCGHSVREQVNEMIHHWMEDEKDEFYESLQKLKDIVKQPGQTPVEDAAMWWGPAGAVGSGEAGSDDDDEVIDVVPGKIEAAPATGGAAAGAARDTVFFEDLYALLGLQQNADADEIRMRFREVVMKEHPERGGNAELFQRYNKAYSILSDVEKRSQYDKELAIRAAVVGQPMGRS